MSNRHHSHRFTGDWIKSPETALASFLWLPGPHLPEHPGASLSWALRLLPQCTASLTSCLCSFSSLLWNFSASNPLFSGLSNMLFLDPLDHGCLKPFSGSPILQEKKMETLHHGWDETLLHPLCQICRTSHGRASASLISRGFPLLLHWLTHIVIELHSESMSPNEAFSDLPSGLQEDLVRQW